MPRIKNQLAKGNLIKSLWISGAITAVFTTIGLAISIPVYQNTKKQLNKTEAEVVDLSKFMNDLSNKLGIPPGQEFEKELADGYFLVYSDGKTQIFTGSGNNKSLVMNMNVDGTVGSAAQLEGPAAQNMLEIIAEAELTIGTEIEAMSDIMKDYFDHIRDSSLATESAITGIAKSALVARNALSVEGVLTPEEKNKLLEEAAKDSGIQLDEIKKHEKLVEQLINKRNQIIQEEAEASKLGKNELAELRKKRAIEIKQEAIKYLNDNNHPLTNVIVNNKNYSDISLDGNEEALNNYYQEMKIKDASDQIADSKRKIAITWLEKHNISYKKVWFKDILKDGIHAQEQYFENLADKTHDDILQDFYTHHVAQNAYDKKRDHQFKKGTSSENNSSFLQKIASSITSWPNMYVKAKYGYITSEGIFVKSSKNLLAGLKTILLQKGVLESRYNKATKNFWWNFRNSKRKTYKNFWIKQFD